MESILQQFNPITLQEMKAVQLMNRVDQKYLTSTDKLPLLLQAIQPYYRVQHIGDEAVSSYSTLYFDTPELEMYTLHHNRKLHRLKLRIRTYRSTLTTFFELKEKDNRGKTHKTRIKVPASTFNSALQQADIQQFISEHTPYSHGMLSQQVENSFSRITLVDNGMHERVTIDFGIRFHNRSTHIDYDLSDLVIIEVKHEVGAPKSSIEQALLQLRIPPRRVSKYCIGTVLTNPDAKHNRFKAKIRYINKITHHETTATDI